MLRYVATLTIEDVTSYPTEVTNREGLVRQSNEQTNTRYIAIGTIRATSEGHV